VQLRRLGRGLALRAHLQQGILGAQIRGCRAKAQDPVKALYENKGDDEPVAGAWLFQKWEPGAFAESTANKNHYFYGAKSVRPYSGGYTEEKPGVYKYTHTTEDRVRLRRRSRLGYSR
jgi:hypothetical protein